MKERFKNSSYGQEKGYALWQIQNQCSRYDEGIRRCDFCHCIVNNRELEIEKHAKTCPLKIIHPIY